MNSNQKKLKQMIRDQELTISDEELFTSSAYQKYLTSMAKSATGRYRQGLQALMEWDARADAGIAHTDNYKIHINAANEITRVFLPGICVPKALSDSMGMRLPTCCSQILQP